MNFFCPVLTSLSSVSFGISVLGLGILAYAIAKAPVFIRHSTCSAGLDRVQPFLVCFEFCFWHWLSYIASGVNVSQCLYLSYLLEVINSQCHCPTDPGINVPVGLFSAYDQFTLDYIFIRIIVTVKK